MGSKEGGGAEATSSWWWAPTAVSAHMHALSDALLTTAAFSEVREEVLSGREAGKELPNRASMGLRANGTV